MAEYIEREAFIKWIEGTYCKPCEEAKRDYNHCRCGSCQYDDMMRDVESYKQSADVRPVAKKEDVMAALRNYFTIGDSYTYELTRSKDAFEIGTMSLDDFWEWDEYNISDLCEYLMENIFSSKDSGVKEV